MKDKLWRFTDNFGSFSSTNARQLKGPYFPLCNELLMSCVTPDLHGDIKINNNSFLLQPVSRIDLASLRSSRNFWVYINKDKVWSATGVSKNLKQIQEDKFKLEAGLLWHKITRENQGIGLKSEILSFVPLEEPVEIMQVKLTNISKRKISLIPTAAIPIYARGANNLRDHRHVTSLLHRIILDEFGVMVKPTLSFDEAGHRPNKNTYFVLGWTDKFMPPQYLYPAQEIFCGEEGDLEAPNSILNNLLPEKERIQGKEAMGALRFSKVDLRPQESRAYTIILGISEDKLKIKGLVNKFNRLSKVESAFKQTKNFWISAASEVNLSTGNPDFDNWFRWVSIQPKLRKIFGCSFLPDFDYGKGGRGWRDLWQDCLGLILSNPHSVRRLLINNFSGVRIDGTNATIIGKRDGEFIADRNNISRAWMDHGIWPLLTLDLYINETGDLNILFEETAYFRDCAGKSYKGTVLEHLLIENLVRFFNVGSHNHLRLEGADWNDGLDMAKENGESVAFSCMYAHNLRLLSELLKKTGRRKIKIAKELKILLGKVNYNDIKAKQNTLEKYLLKTKSNLSGDKISIDTAWLVRDLEDKAQWMVNHIRKSEWLKMGFFNGYYDNQKRRVEGRKNNIVRMMLQSQVFPIMSGVAQGQQIKDILKNIQKYLFDNKLKGYHLNTNFKSEQHNLGRAFSFVYGDKENGAFFSHMIVMLAFSLYKRNFIKEGWQVLSSIYNMAINTTESKIYPCLPEYFNLEGRGMYTYLTGSASWFLLTLLTQVFGIKGRNGDLFIEPKLTPEQFKDSSHISIYRTFAGKRLQIRFSNPKKLSPGSYKIIEAKLNSRNLLSEASDSLIIPRKTILKLPINKLNTLNILLG